MKRDPDKLRAWRQRSAAKAAASAAGKPRAALKRSSGLTGGKPRAKAADSSDRPKAPPVGPMRPGAWREAVWHLDEGKCVGCGKSVPLEADRWVWQAHHPIEKQKLPPGRKYDPRNGVVTCRRCHERHTTWTAVIDGSKLPARCFEFAAELGTWAEDVLDRAHPTRNPAAGSSGSSNTGEQ